MGKIITVTASRGGVGKSTTTINLARAFMDRDLKVSCVDLDRDNQTLLRYPRIWSAVKGEDVESPLPSIIQLGDNFTKEDLLRMASFVDILMVDMQAGFQRDLPRVAAVTNLLIVPTRAGITEWVPGVETARQASIFAMKNGGLPHVRLLFNDVDVTRPATMSAIDEILKMALPVPLLGTMIPRRTGIAAAAEQGSTVFDYPQTRPMRALYRQMADEVLAIIGA